MLPHIKQAVAASDLCSKFLDLCLAPLRFPLISAIFTVLSSLVSYKFGTVAVILVFILAFLFQTLFLQYRLMSHILNYSSCRLFCLAYLYAYSLSCSLIDALFLCSMHDSAKCSKYVEIQDFSICSQTCHSHVAFYSCPCQHHSEVCTMALN